MTKRIVLLQAIDSSPRDLRLALGQPDPALLHLRPSPGVWSIGDVLNHLADVEPHFLARLKRVVAEDNPHVAAFGPDEVAGAQQHRTDLDADALLDLFAERRRATVNWLRALPAGAWQRKAVHDTLGETSLRLMVQQMVNHDIEHLSQVVEIQGQLRRVR